jgi:starvation-inducible DNA-binding protein
MAAKDRRGTGGAHLSASANRETTAVRAISSALNALTADMFALYLKTKNFHWHVSGPHFRDYHLLLDEQAARIFATIDALAERVRKCGGGALRSIGHIVRLQRIIDNDADYVTSFEMLSELREDNIQLAAHLRDAHRLCDEHEDFATASLLENWIDEAEGRSWFLLETARPGNGDE